jgi:2-methylisocitrate lyase-like PEP mutase family enzyme
VLFIESPETMAEMRTIGETFRGRVPLLANQVEGGRTPMPGADALRQMGYAAAIFPVALERRYATDPPAGDSD